MNIATIVIPKQDSTFWLAQKKRKIGAGKWNGWGGRMELEDKGDATLTAVREFSEETMNATARKEDMKKVAIIDFYRAGAHIFECHIYFLYSWVGDIRESAEMGPPQTFKESELPYAEMLAADQLWFPLIARGQKIRAQCFYNSDNSEVESFAFQPLQED